MSVKFLVDKDKKDLRTGKRQKIETNQKIGYEKVGKKYVVFSKDCSLDKDQSPRKPIFFNE